MRSVSVYYLDRAYYVVTLYGSEGGDPCAEVGPVARLARPDDAAELGRAVRHGLAQCRYDFAFPSSRDAWTSVPIPLVGATGLKTWAAVAKRADHVRVDEKGLNTRLSPTARGPAQSFYPVPDRDVSLNVPTDEDLGGAVMSELDFARAREGPA